MSLPPSTAPSDGTVAWEVAHPGGLIGDMPPEIVMGVMGYLDGAAQASFALTNRAFYRQYMPLSMDASAKRELLILLEKGLEEHYYCFFCNKLHGFMDETWRRWVNSFYSNRMLPCLDIDNDHARWVDGSIRLPYNLARQFVNYHLKGDGFELHHLDFTAIDWDMRKQPRSQATIKCVGRIVDDELLIHCTTTMWNTDGDAKDLRHFADYHRVGICLHFCTIDRFRYCSDDVPLDKPWRGVADHPSCRTRIDGMASGAGEPEHFAPCREEPKSCPKCMTEFSVEVRRRQVEEGEKEVEVEEECEFDGGVQMEEEEEKEEEKEEEESQEPPKKRVRIGEEHQDWEIRIETYYNLGSLRSPYDWHWRMMTGSSNPDLEPRWTKDAARYGPGIVRHKWTTAGDEVVVPPGGEWARLQAFS